MLYSSILTMWFGYRCGGVSAAREAVVPARWFVDPEVHQGVTVMDSEIHRWLMR